MREMKDAITNPLISKERGERERGIVIEESLNSNFR